MTVEHITYLIRHTLFTAIEIAAPFLLLALFVGILISVLQKITQIHEMTLSFVPKMLAVACALAIFFPWMLKILTKYTHNLLIFQWEKVISYLQYP